MSREINLNQKETLEKKVLTMFCDDASAKQICMKRNCFALESC